MNLYILSGRSLLYTVSHDLVYELEDIIVQTCDATLLIPTARGITKWCWQNKRNRVAQTVNKVVEKTIGSYHQLDDSFEVSGNDNVLLIIGHNGLSLKWLTSITNWRQYFKTVAAYICDGWLWEIGIYPKYTREIDHLFVPMPEIVEPLQKYLGIPVSLMPYGSDVLTHGSGDSERLIDMISYGRMPDSYHQTFTKAFNYPGSGKLYYRVTPRPAQLFMESYHKNTLIQEDRLLFFKLLRRSKLALAFDPMYAYPGMRKFPHSVITMRWFECGAAGCGIIGKRPTTPLAEELLNWEDATIELPDDPEASLELVEELLKDEQRLKNIHKRNYLENLARHDWRYRIKDILSTLDIPLPECLVQEIAQLEKLVAHQTIVA